MMKFIWKTLLTVALAALPLGLGYAEMLDPTLNWTRVSSHVSMINLIASQLLVGSAFVIGVAFSFSALLKVKYHYENPTQIPLNQAVFLLIFGVVLMCLPLFYYLTAGQAQGAQAAVHIPSGVAIGLHG